MANIRINALPADTNPNASDVVPIDNATTRKTTLTNLVNAGRPFASQAEAEAGVVSTKGMSPLTTAQAIAAIGGAAFAATGRGLPAGGSSNQILAKSSGTDYDVEWTNAGAGDVFGPGSATDSSIVAFDGTTGKLLKDGAIATSTLLRADTTANLTAGFTATCYNAGTKSTGTFTPDPANGNLQRAVNGGAHTLAPPSIGSGDALTMVIQYTNNGSAGAVTTSGFTKKTGDSITTTNGDDFMLYISVVNGFSHLNVVALQ